MAKRKHAELPVGVDRLAKLNGQANTLRNLRARCTAMLRKQEWTVSDLNGFFRGVCTAVGVELEGK